MLDAARPTAGDTALPPERVTWALAKVSRLVPRASCLPRAIAAELLLTRMGYRATLHIGVARTHRHGLEAHAWVDSEGIIVVGGEGIGGRFERSAARSERPAREAAG